MNNPDLIYAYTRADAIADGVLVDVTPMAREAGFTIPVALTCAVWEDCVEWSDADTERQVPQDVEGRLWDVLYMAFLAAKRSRPGDSAIWVDLYRVPRGGRARKPRPVRLKAVVGPGDNAEPVVTIMQEGED